MSDNVSRCFDDFDILCLNAIRKISLLEEEIVMNQGYLRQFNKAQQKALKSSLINIGIAYEHLMEAYREVK